jgi:VanZ family protein
MAPRLRTGARAVFVVYALVIVTLTHWPGMQIEGPVPRSDLWAHLGAFGLWGLLFGCAGWFGRPDTRRGFLAAWGVGIVYTAIDEATQAIPALRRVAAWDDWAANLMGFTLGLIASAVLLRVLDRAGSRSARPPADTDPA